MAGIRSGFGWEVNTCFLFRRTQERESSFQSERERLLGIIAAEGIAVESPLHFPLNHNSFDDQVVHEVLVNFNGDKEKMIALVPGAKRPQNRYPIDRFKVLAAWLVKRGYSVVVIGGREDELAGEQLQIN